MDGNFNRDGYMNHNVITVNGLEYKAVKGTNCRKCAFFTVDCDDDKYNCEAFSRGDGESVIFKRHIKLKSK